MRLTVGHRVLLHMDARQPNSGQSRPPGRNRSNLLLAQALFLRNHGSDPLGESRLAYSFDERRGTIGVTKQATIEQQLAKMLYARAPLSGQS